MAPPAGIVSGPRYGTSPAADSPLLTSHARPDCCSRIGCGGGWDGHGGIRTRVGGSGANMRDGRPQRVNSPAELGFGIGRRPAIDLTVQRLPGVDFVEVIAESMQPDAVPSSLGTLLDRGMPVVPHGVSLSLGGAAAPDGK